MQLISMGSSPQAITRRVVCLNSEARALYLDAMHDYNYVTCELFSLREYCAAVQLPFSFAALLAIRTSPRLERAIGDALARVRHDYHLMHALRAVDAA